MAVSRRRVFIAGGTGYMGSRLIPALLRRGHEVRALVRKGSEKKLVSGCMAVAGDPLELASYAGRVAPSETFVHLVGVPHPSPRKAEQFRSVDLPALRNSVEAAVKAGVQHLVYVSVAHPAPMMQAYIEVRMALRGDYSRQRPEGDDPAAVVCAGAGTSLAVCAGAHVLAGGAAAGYARGSAAPRAGHAGADGERAGRGGGESSCRGAGAGGAANPGLGEGVQSGDGPGEGLEIQPL